jgi:hypothetical protein
MDLAVAHTVAAKLQGEGHKIDAWQMRSLWHTCRAAKERLLGDPERESEPIVVLGRGSKLIGGTIRTELSRGDVERVLIDGFFPECAVDDRPASGERSGMLELGLPYESDPAVTRHLAQFLKRHPADGNEAADAGTGKLPTAVLFNGGVMKSPALAGRVLEVLRGWSGSEVKLLAGADLDLAVARGAAYYGLARRGSGVRIRGGTARAYYIGIASSMPAVPGVPAPLKAVCVAPFGMEEGSEESLPGREFGLVVGEPVMATLPADESESAPGSTVPVRLHSKVTELGTLELWCVSRDERGRWKLEFNVRERVEAK